MQVQINNINQYSYYAPVNYTYADTGTGRVTTFVVMNNTGLPDKDIYVSFQNTANILQAADCTTCSAPIQLYGGKDSVAATNLTTLLNSAGVGECTDTPINLKDMRGWVLSNAAHGNNYTPTTSEKWWLRQTYHDLIPNNPDSTVTGHFPTFTLGLFSACTDTKAAGRIAFSALAPFTEDLFSNSPPIIPPYVLLEGSVFPTDKLPWSPGASNFDSSCVDSLGIPANFELYGGNLSSSWAALGSESYSNGGTLIIDQKASEIFNDAGSDIQSNLFTDTTGKYKTFYAWTHSLSSSSPAPAPMDYFIHTLMDNWTQSTTTAIAPQVFQVASYKAQTFVGNPNAIPIPFGNSYYNNPLDYNFGGYFGYFDTSTSSVADVNL